MHPTFSFLRSAKIKSCLFLLLCSGALLISRPLAQAQVMESDNYRITFGNFNVTSGEKTSTTYKLTDTVGQIAPGQYGLSGSIVKGGFQYIYPFRSLSIKVTKTWVDLGELTWGDFASDDHDVIIDTNGAGGYVVKTAAQRPFQLQGGIDAIDPTNCDSGCSLSTAGAWTNPLNHGFGYNVQNVVGSDVLADFASINHFRPFADLSANDLLQTIMSGTGININRSATITYKVAPSSDQTAGEYETTILFTAIPTY